MKSSKGLKESRYNEKTVKRSEWSFEIERNGNYGDFLTSGDWKSSDGYRSKPRPQIASWALEHPKIRCVDGEH